MSQNLILLSIVSLVLASCGAVNSNNDSSPLPAPTSPKFPVKHIHNFDSLSESKSESEGLEGWEHLDVHTDGKVGVSSKKAYYELALKQEREIIVAVIDSGVDYKHEDLKDVMWINKNEIANNGIDDDGNGYIDDIHGWNFIGGKDGSHIDGETLEVTRIYTKLRKKVDVGEVLTTEEHTLFLEVKEEVETVVNRATKMVETTKENLVKFKKYHAILEEAGISISYEAADQIEDIQSEDEKVLEAKTDLLAMWKRFSRSREKTLEGKLNDYLSHFEGQLKNHYNINSTERADIVGDNPDDFTDTNYGNNDVKGPDSSHGTHVAGSIAATRGNGIGIDGIASNVKIMALRAVPNGDERDKDIALSVRYAADNGAHIINMSFGKGYSPNKAEVDAAFKYAASKGVLILHAAGNSSKNVDKGLNNFPNSYAIEGSGVLKVNTIPNWIEVGASTHMFNANLIASFSNFGQEAVTFFSPGREIYSTTPENEYASFSGTSMATPVAAGVAALLMSEFPEMTGEQARDLLIFTVKVFTPEEKAVKKNYVQTPGASDFDLPVPFENFSATGGLVNAFNAVKFTRELLLEN